MGLGKFFKSIVSPTALADEIIRLQIAACDEARKLYPGADPHVLLNHAWVSRMAARGAVDPMLPETHQKGFVITWPFSLVEWPHNARALGLYVLNEERPDITKAHPQYAREFDSLLQPIGRLTKSNLFFETYERKNPNMAYEATREFEGGWRFGPKQVVRREQRTVRAPDAEQARIEVEERPDQCLTCEASPVAVILYGTPDSINIAALEAGDEVMGGCTIHGDSPGWRCTFCGQNYHRARVAGGDKLVEVVIP